MLEGGEQIDATCVVAAGDVRRALLELPSADMYEKSYMHREWITHIVTTASDFLVTASRDGHLKFWKKLQKDFQRMPPEGKARSLVEAIHALTPPTAHRPARAHHASQSAAL